MTDGEGLPTCMLPAFGGTEPTCGSVVAISSDSCRFLAVTAFLHGPDRTRPMARDRFGSWREVGQGERNGGRIGIFLEGSYFYQQETLFLAPSLHHEDARIA
ncbi:hypothetical protein [Paracoccus versutus]|uniref:hypothetical protein n=1 Tax=Paracoccus versutus TaxID=34007 RepID=UPI0011C01C9C|nr:hypothetical protein [Paracoccus versutus]